MQKRMLYIILGAVALVLVGLGIGIFVRSAITSANVVVPTPTPRPTTTTTPSKGNGVAKILPQYAPDIRTQIAQGLKMTPDQLTAQLQAGKTLSDIAVAQGVASTQLQTIIGNAVRTALQPAVSNGDLTLKQLDQLIKRFTTNPTLLDRILSGGGGAKGKKQATPAATATPAQ